MSSENFDVDVERRELAKLDLEESITEYQELKEKYLNRHDDSDNAPELETVSDRLDDIERLSLFQNERPRPTVIEWNDIEVEDREWLIPQWLPANTVTMFTGDGGAGKSWLTLQVCCQIACGFQDAYLDPDYEITPPAEYDDSVIPKHRSFATYEDEPAEIKRRLQALASGMQWIANSMDIIKKHLHIVDMRGIGSVWGPGTGKHIQNTGDLLAAGEDLREICEKQNAKLLVLDPLSGGFGGNENDRTAVYDFVSSFRGWGDKAQCAMLVIGHLPKGAEARAAGFSGSTAWEASARSMWMLSKKGKGSEEHWLLANTKNNYAPLQKKKYLCRNEIGAWAEATSDKTAIKAYQAYKKKYGIEEDSDE